MTWKFLKIHSQIWSKNITHTLTGLLDWDLKILERIWVDIMDVLSIPCVGKDLEPKRA